MTFEIRKNVPKPSTARGSNSVAKYPFALMEVGDSFIISDTVSVEAKRRAASAINAAHKRFPSRVFSQRADTEGRIGVWRDTDLASPRGAQQSLSLTPTL